MEKLVSVVGISIGLILFAGLGWSAETIRVNTTSGPPLATPTQDGFQDLIAKEVFRRVGQDAEIHILPGERSLINLNQGIDDVTFVRIKGLERVYPNIRMVPEKVMDWMFVGFKKLPNTVISDWRGLKPYSVAYMNGWKIFEENVKHAKFITKVGSPQILFYMLENDRADIILYEKWSGLKVIRDRNWTHVRKIEPPLAVREMFMYVHKKHETVVPALTAALRALKADGTYDRIFQMTLGKLLAE